MGTDIAWDLGRGLIAESSGLFSLIRNYFIQIYNAEFIALWIWIIYRQ